ncbi:MAG TPA: cupin domain-containing protein [Opitutaceae bacterium]|jgi:uncharacterized cupin superfamily protein
MKTVQIEQLPWVEQKSPKEKYRSFAKNISWELGGQRDVGLWGGGHPFDLQMRRVPPGAAICPFHQHQAQWELFVVVSGRATVRVNDGAHEVGAGEAFMQAPGTAHQIQNTGAEDFVFYVIADNPQYDSCYYPDSKKWILKPSRLCFRAESAVGYFDGEE